MKLLILTQKVDKNDDVLGFFHAWLEKFAEQFEKITAICLQKSAYQLPDNVKILSLGKPMQDWPVSNVKKFWGKLKTILNFYKFIWQNRKEYDAVFVHMNPIYLVLAGWFWKLWNKKIILWYIHPKADLKLKIAHIFADKILSATEQTFPKKSKKLIVTGHGINTELFKKMPDYGPKNSILYVGRISPVKNLGILVQAANKLHYKNIDFALTFVGGPDKHFIDYYEKIRKESNHLENVGKIKFLGQVPNKKMPGIYNQHEVLINLTDSGSFDKAILEAMACGNLVLVYNKVFEKILPGEFIVENKNFDDLENKLCWIFNLSQEAKEKYGKEFRRYILENHNLEELIKKIKKTYEEID